MAFSFYSSLKNIPREMREAAQVYRLELVAEIPATGAAVRGDRADMELDDVGGRRMVFPDGVRDVRAGQSGSSAARPGLLPANRRECGKHAGDPVGTCGDDRGHRPDRSADLAAGRSPGARSSSSNRSKPWRHRTRRFWIFCGIRGFCTLLAGYLSLPCAKHWTCARARKHLGADAGLRAPAGQRGGGVGALLVACCLLWHMPWSG